MVTITDEKYNKIKYKADKWDALEDEYIELTEVDEETGEYLNPDVDLCTLGELLQKHFGFE